MTNRSDSGPPLQFDHAEFDQGDATPAQQCSTCGGALGARYCFVNAHIVGKGCSRKV